MNVKQITSIWELEGIEQSFFTVGLEIKNNYFVFMTPKNNSVGNFKPTLYSIKEAKEFYQKHNLKYLKKGNYYHKEGTFSFIIDEIENILKEKTNFIWKYARD